jgi:hypothetical protein
MTEDLEKNIENIKNRWPEIKKNILKRRKTKAQRQARKKNR